MIRDWLIALLLCLAAVAFFMAPPRSAATTEALSWWTSFGWWAQSNLFPNERGLNVAVLDAEGRPMLSKAFDTHWESDAGFIALIAGLPEEVWVVVAAQDDASRGLSAEGVAALQSLGGTTALSGKFRTSYLLVGRPRLGPGAGLEWVDLGLLDVKLEAGHEVAGKPLPVPLHMRSAGLDAGAFASLTSGPVGWENLRQWIWIALRRG